METERRTRLFAVALGSALLALLLVPGIVAPALGETNPNPTQAPESWAYGTVHYVNETINSTYGAYQLTAAFGWTVVFTLTNTSNSTFELEAQRTLGVHYVAELCNPNCASPRRVLQATVHGYEQETGFANFTTDGSVDENGTASAALAILNTHSVGAAALNESLAINRTSPVAQSYVADLRVSASSDAQVSFGNGLGLIPWNLAPGLGWNSSGSFAATGSYRTGYAWTISGNNGTGPVALNGSGGQPGSVNVSGTIGLMGEDFGNLTLRNGVSAPVIAIAWTAGPFVGLDGIILVPSGFEIFGGAAHAWAAYGASAQAVSTSRLDFGVDLVHHRVRVLASASLYQGSDTLESTAAATGAAPAVATGDPSLVQAQPMTVAQAQATASCLSTGCTGSPSSSGGVSGHLGDLLPLVAVGLVAVAVVGAIGTVEYRQRMRRREERRLQSGFAYQGLVNGAPAAPLPPNAPASPPALGSPGSPSAPEAPRPPNA